MKGPNGLRPGQVIHLQPDLDFLNDKPDAELEDFDTSVVVVYWPGGGMGYVDASPHGILYRDKPDDEYGFFHRGDVRAESLDHGFVLCNKITDDFEWFPDQRQAILAACEEESEYAARAKNRAATARRIAQS